MVTVFHAVVRAKSELYGGKQPPALGVWGSQPFKKNPKNPKIQKCFWDGCLHESLLSYLGAWPMGHQHLEECRSWVGVKKRPKPPILRGTKNSITVMVCARAVGLDQWVASIWRNDAKGLGVWGKKRQKPPVLCWQTCLSASAKLP